MTVANSGASGAAAIANAVKASGVLVKLEPSEWSQLLNRVQSPLVVASEGGAFGKRYRYLTSYKGLAFYTQSREPLPLPGDAELIRAKSIWIPG